MRMPVIVVVAGRVVVVVGARVGMVVVRRLVVPVAVLLAMAVIVRTVVLVVVRVIEVAGVGHACDSVLMYAPPHSLAGEVDQPTGEQARAAADLLRLLADPTRLRLLAALTAADRDVTELTELTGVPRPAVSQHLSKLRLGGLVEAHPDGRRRIYTVKNGHVRRLVTETLAHADHLLSGLPDHE